MAAGVVDTYNPLRSRERRLGGKSPVRPASQLIGFVIRQALGGSLGEAIDILAHHFKDHSRLLPKALARANDQAWKAPARGTARAFHAWSFALARAFGRMPLWSLKWGARRQ